MLNRCELSYDDHLTLFSYCNEIGVDFLSTPYHPSAVELLEKIGVDRYKVASADLRDVFLLDAIMKTNKRIILSTGMASQNDVTEAIDYIVNQNKYDKTKLALLHCTSDYPCNSEDGNLNFLEFLKGFKIKIGFSDHSIGSHQALVALGFGAEIFEKHITLDKAAIGPDHRASCDIDEFCNYVDDLSIGFSSLGAINKNTIDSEISMKFTSHKSLVYKQDLNAGTVLSKDHMSAMRPLDGIPVFQYSEFIGKTLIKSVFKNDNLAEDHFG